MISVMVSKWVADAFGKDGIYPTWIAMRQYPWLPAREYRDKGETAVHVMKPAENLVVVRDDGRGGCLLRELDALVRFVRRGVESLAAGAGEAAPAFGVFAFALEDWDR